MVRNTSSRVTIALIAALCIYLTYLLYDSASRESLMLSRKILNWVYANKPYQHIMDTSSYEELYSDYNYRITEKLHVDDNHNLTESEIVSLIQKREPNLPIEFWVENKNKNMGFNNTCAKFPSILNLKYNNIYWQILETTNKTYFYLYSAYFDNRALVKEKSVVRIICMTSTVEPYVETYCQLWFPGQNKPVFSKVSSTQRIWVKGWGGNINGILQPYLLTCEIPPSTITGATPATVSLVEHPCDYATNHLTVVNNQPEIGYKKDFAVCVKGLDFLRNDKSVQLVEWLELLFLMGVDKVFIYTMGNHPNNTKVLEHYQSENKVKIIPITLPGFYPNLYDLRHMFLLKKIIEKYLTELIPYNDCFYNNMNLYKFISLLDVDEIIMPRKSNDWKGLLNTIRENDKKPVRISSYIFRNVFVSDSMREPHGWNSSYPKYMKMSQNVWRYINHSEPGHAIKAFHDTERIRALHNHFPMGCIDGPCRHFSVDPEDAHLMHYKERCRGKFAKDCLIEMQRNSVKDTSVSRHIEKLMPRTRRTLTKLGFLST